MESEGGSDMTLAFELVALEALANPRAVFADARRWSTHLGVVAEDPDAARAFVDRYRLRQDYELDELERRAILSKLMWEADTERFVLVGARAVDRSLADHVGWEYLDVEEAATKAEWQLAAEAGVIDRVRARLARMAPWPV